MSFLSLQTTCPTEMEGKQQSTDSHGNQEDAAIHAASCAYCNNCFYT